MGLNLNSIKLLFEAKAAGACFEKTLTLGRQSFCCHPLFFDELKLKFGIAGMDASPAINNEPGFAEPFLQLLGAKEIIALDNSNYEGAQRIHDMNTPIEPGLVGQFDAVIDGGTLEHIFNFPVAIKNCMDMVRTGGHLFLITPINNYCGHGFYQFSPELFFRILGRENGFVIERTIAWEEGPIPEYFEVNDPAIIHQRVELINKLPVLMFVQARKIRQVQGLAAPQQSDYVALWENRAPFAQNESKRTSLKSKLFRFVRERLPRFAQLADHFRHRHKARALSLLQKPGFCELGKLSSRKVSDRLRPVGE